MSERIVAVVPIRSLRDGKTRLAPVLSVEARAALLRRVAERVMDAAMRSGVVETVLVVSLDPDVLDWAANFGDPVVPLPQPADWPGLNGAIGAGREWATERGAARLLSLFADLPLVAAEDLRAMTERVEPVVLGPDRRGEGTNALLLRLAGGGADFRFSFGQGSLRRHLAEAARLRLPATTFVSRGIGFDLDTPADWNDFLDAVCGDGGAVSAPLAPGGVCAG